MPQASHEETTRLHDAAARLGGDEFALLLPEVDTADAIAAAERLRKGLEEQEVDEGRSVTATRGVAVDPKDGRTAADLLRPDDRVMYAGERTGKNRTLAVAGRVRLGLILTGVC